jgi:CubicO group peptidase (beta-lactamase class C family)
MAGDFRPVASLIDSARNARAFPAATIEVGRRDCVLWRAAFGRLTYEPDASAATPDTIFDLASLTKVIATTPLVMRLVARRRLLLNAPVAGLLPGWYGADRTGVTVADLLEHTAGLTTWWDFYKRASTPREVLHEIAELPLEYRPRSRSIYSDLGFLVLGFLVEAVGGETLDAQFGSWLGSPAIGFRPGQAAAPGIAPTEDDRVWRGRLLIGEVHDENAAALGGVAGHAGLFGSAPAVGAYARLVLETLRQTTTLGEPWLLRRFLRKSTVSGSSRALGWDTMLPTSSCGTHMSRAAFGHTGFTGTSLWIDPIRDVYVVLLTNRVHPQRPHEADDPLRELRPAVHDAIAAAVD